MRIAGPIIELYNLAEQDIFTQKYICELIMFTILYNMLKGGLQVNMVKQK